MSDLVAVLFEDTTTAFEMRAAVVKMQSEYLLELEDAVVVTKDEDGKVKLHQAVNLTAAGAVSGSFWGLLIGMLFLNPLLGVAVGAGSGALTGTNRSSMPFAPPSSSVCTISGTCWCSSGLYVLRFPARDG